MKKLYSNVVACKSHCKLSLQHVFNTGKNSFINRDNFVKAYKQHFLKTYLSIFYIKKNDNAKNQPIKK